MPTCVDQSHLWMAWKLCSLLWAFLVATYTPRASHSEVLCGSLVLVQCGW